MVRKVRSLALALPLVMGCGHLYGQGATSFDLQRAVRESQFIFLGTVQKLGATTMPVVPVSPTTAIVRVDEVIAAPTSIGDQTGQQVTIALRRPDSVREGQQSVFFTEGWIYGDGLAVREVDRLDGRPATADLREAVAEAIQLNEEEDLADLLSRAELVVVGRIVRTVAVDRNEHRLPITEHDPDLHRAFVEVATLLKGEAPAQGQVSFLFANSRDVMWDRSPKPTEGQVGVWILLRDEMPALPLEGLTAFDPRAVQPRERAEVVRRLLGSP